MRIIAPLRISTFVWIVTFSLFLVIAGSSALSTISIRSAEKMEAAWVEFEKISAEKALLLNQIQGLLGYDGIIYHYNKFVMRKNRQSVLVVQQKLLQLSIALAAYKSLGLDAQEKKAFLTLSKTTGQYHTLVSMAEIMVDIGNTPTEIDGAIRIDEDALISSFSVLNQRHLQLYRSNSKAVRDTVETHTAISKISRTVLVAMLLALAVLILWYIRWRLILPFNEFIAAFKKLSPDDHRLIHLPYDDRIKNTELGAFATAFNQMADLLASNIRELSFQKHALDEHSIVSMADIRGNITYVNDKFCTISGYTREELIGQNHRLLKSDEHPQDFFADMWKTIANGKTWNAEIKNKNKEGDDYWVQTTIVPTLNDAGKPFQYVSIRTDITSEKLKEIELIATSEEAKSATIAKSNFLSTMSHEIRTPLNGVLGLAQLLTDTNLDKNQRQKVDTILSSGQTLLAILNDVLDMSKIEAGGIELESTAFNLRTLISTIATPFQSLADDKGLKLIVSDDVDSNLTLKGDPIRLRQVLWNLLSNAIKFTERGSVTLTISEQDGSNDFVNAKDCLLRFVITDTGAGIASDRIAAIFDAFTQEDTSISRKHGGTGLGLSIVKQLTELMGGKIEAKSTLGKGTTFNVILPFDQASQDETKTISERNTFSPEENTGPLNVLIAEDNEVNALIAKTFLEKFGHHVKHVENGKLAVEAAKEAWADFILMDVHMPEMNGIDATKEIRAMKLGKNLPIIGLTAEAFSDRHSLFIEAGMNGVLTKPFTEHQLADTLAGYRTNSK